MRRLTFKGFLEKYLSEISYSKTCSITKLIKELSSNPRIKEPLAVYSVLNNKAERLKEKNKEFYIECENVRNNIDDITAISEKYLKLYKSYLYASSRKENDDDSKKLMRNKIVELQKEKGISNYRIYCDLNMNHGNVNAFLKYGDCDKLSLANVRKIWSYIEAYN